MESDAIEHEITSIECPRCGKLVPVELILNYSGFENYIDICGLMHDDYAIPNKSESDRSWPVIRIEFRFDVPKLLEDIDKISGMFKKHKKF